VDAPPSPVATPAPVAAVPSAPVDAPSPRGRRLELAGMAGGAGLVVLGLVMWGAASGVQGDIDKAPTTTKQDLVDLKNLESRGDTYAGLGNVFAISGVIVGGIATYYYIRDRRNASAASTASARLTPAVFAHGAGLVLTIGGSP
jgi:uncharacterized membrane protein YedE/YeeE